MTEHEILSSELPMFLKRNMFLGVIAVVIVAAYVAVDTRIGVFLILDVVGAIGDEDPDYDSRNGPLELSAELMPVMEIPLPDAIEQPSGIQHRGDRVYISTDQAELFVLDGQFQTQMERVDLIGGLLLLRQGSLEGIEVVDDSLLAIGEFGAIRTWERDGDGWRRLADEALLADIADVEYSGITYFSGQRYATSEDSPSIVNLDTGMVHELDFGSFLKADGDPSTLQFSGLASEGGRLFVLTESYSSILVVDPNDFRVLAVYGIEPAPVADLAVRDQRAYVVVDHNLDEARPPLFVYGLSARTSVAPN